MSTPGNGIACANCGEPIHGESPSGEPAQRKPCPKCGSTARSFSVQVEVRLSVSGTAQADVITYPQTLLSTAQGLIDQGQFSIAVVVSHMACEIAVERSFSEAFVSKGIPHLVEPVTDLLNGYNLATERIRKL